MIEVELPDGTIAEFPAGTDTAVIEGALQQQFGVQPVSPTQPVDTRTLGQEVGATALTGAQLGVSQLAGLPGDIASLAGLPSSFLRDLALRGVGATPEFISGVQQREAEQFRIPTSADVQRFQESIIGRAPAPETKTGRIAAQAIAGGVGTPLGRIPAAFGAVGQGAGELSAQLAEALGVSETGQAVSRLGGGLTSQLGLGAIRGGGTGAQRLIRDATKDTTEAQFRQAGELQQQAQQLGTPLTGAESLAQVGAPSGKRLLLAQSVAEQSTEGGPALQQFIQQRTLGGQRAVSQALEGFAPVGDPRVAGLAAREAATRGIRAAELERTALTSGTFEATRRKPFGVGSTKFIVDKFDEALSEISPIDTNAISLIQNSKNELLRLPNIGTADDIREVLGQVSKIPLGQTQGVARKSAGIIGKLAGTLNKEVRESSLLRAVGKDKFIEATRQLVDPLQKGIVGVVANTDDVVKQFNAIIDPKLSRPSGIRQAVRVLQQQDAVSVRDVAKVGIENTFDQAFRSLAGGDETFQLAKASVLLNKTPNMGQNLKTLVESLPDGKNSWAGFRKLMEVAEAQGKRFAVGSRTEFSQQLRREISKGGAIEELVKSAPDVARGSALGGLVDFWDGVRAGRNSKMLANVLTDPQSVQKLRQLSKLQANSNEAQQLASEIIFGIRALEDIEGTQE